MHEQYHYRVVPTTNTGRFRTLQYLCEYCQHSEPNNSIIPLWGITMRQEVYFFFKVILIYRITVAAFLHCCPECLSCLAHLTSIGWATWAIWSWYDTLLHSHWVLPRYRVKKYNLYTTKPQYLWLSQHWHKITTIYIAHHNNYTLDVTLLVCRQHSQQTKKAKHQYTTEQKLMHWTTNIDRTSNW